MDMVRPWESENPSRDLSEAVLAAVARAEGKQPAELSPPLFDVIDPDALDHLFDGKPETAGTVAFRYHGYLVIVDQYGRVTVEEETPVPSDPL